MKIKIIVYGGITSTVLSDGEADVEVVGIDKDYADYDDLCAYEAKLMKDGSLHELPFTIADFREEETD